MSSFDPFAHPFIPRASPRPDSKQQRVKMNSFVAILYVSSLAHISLVKPPPTVAFLRFRFTVQGSLVLPGLVACRCDNNEC